MKLVRNLFFFASFSALVMVISGCGSYNGTTATAPIAGKPSAAKRAFVVNQFGGVVDVVDSAKDTLTGATLQVNGNSDSIIVMSNKKSVVHSAGNNSLVELDDATEALLGPVNSFPGPTESIVATPDGLFAYAAIPSLGQISKMDLTTQALTTIPASPSLLPGVRHLAITHNGNTILGFSDNSDNVIFLNRTNDTLTHIVGGFDRPVTALFSSDDSTAYVLNCGKECGGAGVDATHFASIAIVNVSNATITRTVPVRVATVAVMDSTNLYVAGTDPNNSGQLDLMNLTSFAVTSVASPISDGKHTKMALAANNKLYIGAQACSASNGNCLSVYNTGSGTASIVSASSIVPSGDVTAITPIVGRSVVYVIQGGQLVIYDTSTDLPQATQIFISGKVSDVKEVDN